MVTCFSFEVLKDLKSLLQSIKIERDRLKAALEAEIKAGTTINHNQTSNLELSLNQALQQNNELKKRLQRIYEVSDISDLSIIDPNSETVIIINRFWFLSIKKSFFSNDISTSR